MTAWREHCRWMPVLAVVAVLAVKMLIVTTYAPLSLGDNSDMIATANLILKGSFWTAKVDLGASAVPDTSWRPVGYPAAIAASKALFGQHWKVALATVQSLASLVAGLLLWRLCRQAALPAGLSLAVFVLHQWSVPLSTDPLIMGDGLNGTLGLIAMIVILGPVVAGRLPSPLRWLSAGLLLGLSSLLRDGLPIVVAILTLATFAWVARRRGIVPALLAGMAFALPTAATTGTAMAWNHYRLGHAVTSTGGQTVYTFAVLRMARFDPAIIAGDGVVERALRKTNETWDYSDSRRANDSLFTDYGMNAVAQTQAAQKVFWNAVVHHPAALLRNMLDNLRPIQQGTLFTGPLTRLDDLRWWAGLMRDVDNVDGWRAQARQMLATGDLKALPASVVALMVVNGTTRAVGLALLAVFALGTPTLAWRLRDRADGAIAAALIAWGVYGTLVTLCLPVNLEMRYLSPVVGGALFATAVVFSRRHVLWRREHHPQFVR